MKTIVFSVGALVLLGACQTTTDPAVGSSSSDPVQLSTQADIGQIAGRTLQLAGDENVANTVVISMDGTLSGVWQGQPLRGTYEMKGGYFCRVLTEFHAGPVGEDCQLFILDGSTVNVTRDRGDGASFTYVIL